MLQYTIINNAHALTAIQAELGSKGYYLANAGEPCSSPDLMALVDYLGGTWQSETALVQTIAPVSEPRFIAQTTAAIPPHNECAYAAQPPRYLLLHCQENTVTAGDFYLVDSADVIGTLTQEAIGLFYHSRFECSVDPTHPQQVTVLKQSSQRYYLQYTCIGHNVDWSDNENYRPVEPFYQGFEGIISSLQQQLRRESLRQNHRWKAGDLLIFDNQRYLHGREAFEGMGRRLDHIRIA